MKKTFYSEAAYALGLTILALGTALMERANFGLSMVVAPAYIIHIKISQYLSWFSFGVAEYCLQAVLLIILAIVVHKFEKKYLFSFVTAFIYGNILDLLMGLVGYVPDGGVVQRLVFFVIGMIICSVGVSLLFHTYITPEAYELFVKEISDKYSKEIQVVKTIYDCCSCLIAVIMSFVFIGFFHFEGIKVGTIICALLNGWLIGNCNRFFEKHFDFVDAFRKNKGKN